MSETTPAEKKHSRRVALRVLGAGALAAGAAAVAGRALGQHDDEPAASSESSLFRRFFRKHYRKMEKAEVRAMIARLEAKYEKQYGKHVEVSDTPAPEGVLFGYALSLDRCKGYRDCVHACVKENNLSREPEMQYIRVLEVDRGEWNLGEADQRYDHAYVPAPGKAYMPMQCFHCENPPCVSACPVQATWKEPDGIVVINYDTCIGCRYCATACPYGARRFNWSEPKIPKDEINTDTHYLGNRPRPVGVIEKCNFCVHRVRRGRMPACQEACPTGARVFGNLLDPKSDIRYVLENKTVFRLREELGAEPKFWYYTG